MIYICIVEYLFWNEIDDINPATKIKKTDSIYIDLLSEWEIETFW